MHDPDCVFGVDVGTTAIKCVIVSQRSREVLAESYVALESLTEAADTSRPGEQRVEVVLKAVHVAVAALPADLRERIAAVSICGQVRCLPWRRKY